MCIFTHFRYLCLHEKIKIAQACDKAFLDRNGVLTCPDDPNPQFDDGKTHTCGPRTYGIGVCDNIHCAWHFSILPLGDYGEDQLFVTSKSGISSSFEDDTEIIDSPEAREDRVARWYHLLNADQQLDHYKTEYPLPCEQRSTAGRLLLEFPYGAAVGPWDGLKWQELNPKCLNPAMLQWCVLDRVLPASVVDGRKSHTISPLQPTKGPLRLTGNHKCPKKHGICKKCGANIGDRVLREATLAHRQKVAFTALQNEDRGKADPMGTVRDPSVDLKWDDEKSRYVKVQTNIEDQIQDHLPYSANSSSDDSGPELSTAQQANISTLFQEEQNTAPLVDDAGDTNMEELGFPDGMDLQDFAEFDPSNIIVTPLATSTGGLYWPDLDFPPGIGKLLASSSSSSSSSQQQPNTNDPFFFDPSVTYDPDFASSGAAEQIDLLTLSGFNPGLFGDSDGDMSMDATTTYEGSQANTTSSDLPSSDPIPLSSSQSSEQNAFPTRGSSNTPPVQLPPVSWEKRIGDFIAEQQVANDSQYYPSPATVRVLGQMLRQATVAGGRPRPSYDQEANELFDMMMQHTLAGLM